MQSKIRPAKRMGKGPAIISKGASRDGTAGRATGRYNAAKSVWVTSGHPAALGPCPLYPQEQTNLEAVGLSAKCHEPTLALYSITSSARASSIGGSGRPSAFAVLRLMTKSNVVDWTTGRSVGFSPLMIRPA